MRTRPLVCAIAALSIAASGVPAFAQDHKDMRSDQAYRDSTGQPGPGETRARRADPRMQSGVPPERRRAPDVRHDRYERGAVAPRYDGRGYGYDRAPAPRYYEPGRSNYRYDDGWRGAGPGYRFHRGERLPPYYRSHQYVVDDWRGHRLSAPPRGYHWVQAGGDYLLVAIATGIIATILLSQ